MNVFEIVKSKERMALLPIDLCWETHKDILDKTAAELANIYPDGCSEWLQQHNPALYKESVQAVDRINEHWEGDIVGFKSAVDAWKRLWERAIQLYQHETTKTLESAATPTDM